MNPGRYLALVQQFEGDTNYPLNLSATPLTTPPDKAGNALGNAKSLGSIGTAQESDFVGNADPVDIYSFSVDTNSSFSLNLDNLIADANVQLIQDVNGNQSVDAGEIISESAAPGANPEQISGGLDPGTYYVRISQVSGDTNYNLSLSAAPGSLVEEEVFAPIAGNDTIQGSLSESDSLRDSFASRFTRLKLNSIVDTYQLTGVRGNQQVSINLSSTQFDTKLELLDAATRTPIAEIDDIAENNTNSALTFTVQSGVQYLIQATSEGLQTGDYTLIASTSSAIVGDLALNQTLTSNLTITDLEKPARPGSFSDDYRLTGILPDRQVEINLNSPQFDTYLELVNAQTGEVIAENDNIDIATTTDAKLTFKSQEGVEYLVRVTSFAENATGNYTLNARAIANADDVATVTPNQTLVGLLDNTDAPNLLIPGRFKDGYRLIEAPVGEQVRVNLESFDFDSYLQIVDSQNRLIVENDNFAADKSNSEATFTVEAGIDYRICVTSAQPNAIGSYTLTTTPVLAPTPTPEPTPTPTPVPVDFFSEKIKDAQLQTLGRNLAADGNLNRNDMLALLRDVQDGGIVDATEIADLRQLIDNSTRFKMPDYVQYLSSKVVEAAIANINAAAFENELIGKWFLGKVAPPADFTYKTIDEFGSVRNDFYQFQYAELKGSLFGSDGEARIGHIDQGGLGYCAFLAALGATFGRQNNDAGNQASSIIQSAIVDNGDNTYSIRFYNETTLKPEYVTVDRRVAIKDGRIFGASADGETDPNNPSNKAIWVPLVERAYAQFMQEKEGIANGYNRIGNGDYVVDPLTRITGRKIIIFRLN